MRILQVIDSLNLGGAEVLVKEMSPRLRRLGYECDVVVLLRSGSAIETSLEAAGVPLHDTGVNKIYSIRQVLPLARLIKSYDIVHVHLFPAQLWTILAARIGKRVPLVTTEHGSNSRRQHAWLRPFDAWMYRQFRAIACVSQATAEEFVKWCPQVASKTRVIPNGVVLESFATAEPAKLDMGTTAVLKVVFVARFELPKDHATLLRAFAKIKTRNAQLLLVGDGPLRPQVHHLACELGIEARVTFLGLRNDVPRILKAADVYVHSTTSEGFGIAACEAMAAGLPIIATDVPGLSDVVGNAGVLVPIGDDEALARELQSVLASPDRRLKMRRLGQERVKLFSIERTAELHAHLYRSVLGQQFSEETS